MPRMHTHRRWRSARVCVDEDAAETAGTSAAAAAAAAAVVIQCSSAIAIATADQLCLTLSRRAVSGERGGAPPPTALEGGGLSPCIPAVLLLHGEEVGRGAGGKEAGGAADDVAWPQVKGRMGGKAWFTRAELLVKITRHQAFVNSLATLLGQTAAIPTRVFTADARGVIRAWSVLADDKGSVTVAHAKSYDIVTLQSADQTEAARPKQQPAAHAGDKENQTQQKLQALQAKAHKQEQHGARSIVCIRVHNAGEASRLAVMSVDSLIRVLDAQSLKLLFTLTGARVQGPNACMKCSWSADGRLLAAGSEDGRLVVWQLPPPAGAGTLPPFSCLCVNPGSLHPKP